jgi:hypothetical protein
MKTLAALTIAALGATAVSAQEPLVYRFDEVRRSVTVTSSAEERRVDPGAQAVSGDKVHTGWFSYALIASDRHRAKFEIFSSTDVRLAAETPGVILSLERGRIRAVFDKITGSEPRVVKTPGALLAVRGTKFDVTVDGAGQTSLEVFEGIVEVQSSFVSEPVFIRAGEGSTFRRNEPPVARPMKGDRPNDGKPRGGDDRSRPPERGGRDGRDGHGADPRQPGGHQQQPPPTTNPRPPKP